MFATLVFRTLTLFLFVAGPIWASPAEPCATAFQLATVGPTPQMDALGGRRIAFETKRLRLATPKREDIPFLAEMFSDPKTVEHTWFVSKDGLWSFEEARQKYESFAESQAKGLRRDFVIRRNEDQTPIGRSAFYRPEGFGEGPGSWEMGITLFRPHWKNGYGPEAVTGLLNHAFKDMGAAEIWFQVLPENEAMQKVCAELKIKKINDAYELEPILTPDGSEHRYHRYRVTKEEWDSRNLDKN